MGADRRAGWHLPSSMLWIVRHIFAWTAGTWGEGEREGERERERAGERERESERERGKKASPQRRREGGWEVSRHAHAHADICE